MVEILRLGKLEKALQHTVEMSRMQEILAASHVSDFLGSVINNNREVVGGSDILASQNGVSEKVWIDLDGAMNLVGEGQFAGELSSLLSVESPGGFAIGGRRCEAPASPGIKRPFRPVRRIGQGGKLRFDFASGAITRVDHIQ